MDPAIWLYSSFDCECMGDAVGERKRKVYKIFISCAGYDMPYSGDKLLGDIAIKIKE